MKTTHAEDLPNRFQWAMVLIPLMGVLIMGLAASQITGARIHKDGQENLMLARNIARSGIFSLDHQTPLKPTNQREPLPPLVVAAHLQGLDRVAPEITKGELGQGKAAYWLKVSNLYWVALGVLGTVLLAQSLTRSLPLILLMMGLVGYLFLALPQVVDSLYTELQAGVLLIWSTWLLLMAWSRPGRRWPLLLGVSLGLLTLVKGVFLYVFPVLMAAEFVGVILGYSNRLRLLQRPFLLLLGMLIPLAPWLLRNWLVLGQAQFTQRGGHVLLTRAVKNRMSQAELPGALYFWGPSLYQKTSSLLGLGATRVDFQSGGRFQHLNREASADFYQADVRAQQEGRPEAAVSYYHKAAAQLERYRFEAIAAGHPKPDAAADRGARRQAVMMIQEQPIRHLWMSGVFAWRGIWSQPNQGVHFKSNGLYVIIKDAIAGLSYAALMLLFVLGLLRRHLPLIALTLLPVFLIAFYALFTHGLARYNSPAIPLMLISLVLVIDRVRPRRRGPEA